MRRLSPIGQHHLLANCILQVLGGKYPLRGFKGLRILSVLNVFFYSFEIDVTSDLRHTFSDVTTIRSYYKIYISAFARRLQIFHR